MTSIETAKLHDAMAAHVDAGAVHGVVTVVRRGGRLAVDALGDATPETIFRISSMTKPIVAAAVMTLVVEGRLALDDPVDAWLPELADRRVLRTPDGPLDDTVPARRAITVRDLLAFTFGFGAVFGASPPLAQRAAELGVATGPPNPAGPPPPDEWLARLGSLPLMYQPGERWQYNTGTDVAGVLLARVCEAPLGHVLRERVFEPLGMGETGFSVPAAQLHRLPACHIATENGLELFDEAGAESRWAAEPAFPSGSGGLVSTAADVLAFADMLLRGGAPLLSAGAVAELTRDQLRPDQKPRGDVFGDHWEDHGWGLGMEVADSGRYGWDGGLGTTWRNAPAQDLVAVILTQRAAFPLLNPVWQDFWRALDGG